MTYREFVKEAEERLKQAGIPEYEADVLELVLSVTGWDRTEYLVHRGDVLPDGQLYALSEMLKKRSLRIPVQQITGTAWFYGYRFTVTPDVLIPRYDTEILVREVLKTVTDRDRTVLDLCTGSGCIAVTLKLEGGYREVLASDISEAALATAKKNAADLGAEIQYIRSDLLRKIPGKVDVIVSNPPYIAADEFPGLDPEVRDHEPRLALYGGADGLDYYRRIASEAPSHLSENGRIFFEIGAGQGEAVSAILEGKGFTEVRVTKDLAGLPRVVSGRFRKAEALKTRSAAEK